MEDKREEINMGLLNESDALQIGGNTVDLPPGDANGVPGIVKTLVMPKPGLDRLSRMITIIASTLPRIIDEGDFVEQYFSPGPITGILDFGSGGNQPTLEFDIPLARGISPNGENFKKAHPSALGISVPASFTKLSARNDSRLFAIFSQQSQQFEDDDIIGLVGVGLATGHVGYEAKTHRKITRTYIAVVSGTPLPAQGQVVVVTIPNYAKRVRIFRNPASQAIDVELNGPPGTSTPHGPYTVPAGSVGPVEVLTRDFFLRLTNPGPASFTFIACEFELEI